MTSYRNLLMMAALILLMSACGGGSETDQTSAAAPEMDEIAPPIEEVQPEPEVAGVAEETSPAETVEVVEESAADEEATDDAADEEIVLAESEPEGEAQAAPQWKFTEGQHFTKLTTAQGTSSAPDVIEVAEVFWYGCPHCYNFEPYIDRWTPSLPDDVRFIRLPVMWNPTNQMHARIFYTAEALKKLDDMHSEIFKEMHINRKMLTSEDEIRAFFARFGVSEDDFNNTFRSFPVESSLKRARNLTVERYRVQSVPLLVVNGKYLTTGPGVKNFDDMLAVTEELIERERL